MSLAEKSETFKRVESALRGKTEAFLSTGIAYFTPRWPPNITDWREARRIWAKELSVTSPTFVRAYLRAVAKELKRPFIHATSHYDRRGGEKGDVLVTELVVPMQKRLECIAGRFLIVADPLKHRYDKSDSAVALIQQTSNWVFRFRGDEGHKIFETFTKGWREDPALRIVLKLS